MTASDRRRFFRELLRSGVEIAQEVSSAVRTEADLPESDPEAWAGPRLARAEPVQRTASVEEFADLCGEVGLSPARTAAVQGLARPSLRLTRADASAAGPAASRLGGAPDLPPGFEWPQRSGRSLASLGQINLGDVAAHLPEAGLPPSGLLLFFYDTEQLPAGLAPSHRGSCRVVLADDVQLLEPDAEQRASFADYPLMLSRELTLPPEHSFHLDPLSLDFEELTAWSRLLERLAEVQGVELEERSGDWFALHRLLGHPDPLYGGAMERDCQLVANGLDVSEGDGYLDPRSEELEAGAADWRLLLQLSSDDALGADWAEPFRRLYLWIREQDLLARDFDQVWAILQ